MSTTDRLLKGFFIVLVLGTCARVWLGPVTILAPAAAQLPDAGAQRADLVRESKKTNELLGNILRTLQERTMKVRVVDSDKNKAPTALPGGRTGEPDSPPEQ